MKRLAGIGAALVGGILATAVATAAMGGASPAAGIGVPGGLLPGVVPEEYRPWLMKAGALCPESSPALLAAQIWAESGFNAQARSPVGALGPAQFMPGTWATWGRDDDTSGTTSPFDVGDAVMAQGRFMCSLLDQAKRSHYPGGTQMLALAGYNAGWGAVEKYHGLPPYKETADYVAKILAKAKEWESAPAISGSGAGAEAVRKASTYVGLPYVWGGGTPAGPSVGFCDGPNGYWQGRCFAASNSGFDCSSLTQNAWWPSVHLPRTAGDQYTATRSRGVSMNALQPGDLIFYSHDGNGANAYHVVMYYGNGKIIEAPRTGKKVQIIPLYRTGGLVGATRPG
uniref:C40 family peptidase n=1 Tax=unclassified Streptomyces TaxID=2593676 RepID=UPI003F49AC1A